MQAVIDRHDILRTGVVWEGLSEPMQVVWRKAVLPVEEVALEVGAGDPAKQLYARYNPRSYRMDARQAPMLRVAIAHDEEAGRWLMMQLLHHLVGDHTTLEVMQEEIQAHLLGEEDRLPAPLLFRNLVAQARFGVSQEEHEAFFRRLLGDVEEPTAPFGLLNAQGDGTGIEQTRVKLEARLSRRVRESARKLGVSAASLCHVAWAQVAARTSGREDVVFGTTLFGRMQGGQDAERAMGVFLNTLPVRIRVGEEGAEQSVRGAHRQLAELLRHEHASLALAQRCSAVPAPTPLFSSLLNYRHSGGGTQARSEKKARAWEGIQGLYGEERTNYPVTLSVDDLGEDFLMKAQVELSIGAMRVCEYMRTALESLVEALEIEPSRPLRALEVMPEAERRQLLYEWNATQAEYPREKRLHHLFEEQVEKTPDAVAVVFEDQQLTYQELNKRANRLAYYLQTLGVGSDGRVGICIDRSLEIVVAMLGVLKAGGAYVPLDPGYPAERKALLISDSGAKVILTSEDLGLPEMLAVRRVCIDQRLLGAGQAENPVVRQDSEALAYLMYTSGSTGQPKGVMVPHRAITRLVLNCGYADFKASDRVAFASNPAFDASTMEIWAPLLNGGLIVAIDQETLLEPAQFGQTLKQRAVNILWLTVGLFNQYADALSEEFAGLRYLIVGGDALDPRVIARVVRGDSPQHLLNGYGPTETITFAATHEITVVPENARSIPIGRPIANTRIHILDRYLEPVPVGVAGELYIGGAGVAHGYLNRPELTAERFIANPFMEEAGARVYKTGDLGRWLAGGTIEFLGRNDFQVKIRGYRIELGEIEARLVGRDGVREAVVVAREDTAGDKRLVAYYTVTETSGVGKEGIGAEQLRLHLSAGLPEYMVPSAYVMLEKLPLTPNGKVDRKALPAPEWDAYGARSYEEPIGETEKELAEIWAELLKLERVSRNDNFFELGGHSLLVVRVISRLRKVLNVEVTIGDVFAYPVLASLADRLINLQLEQFDPDKLAGLLNLMRGSYVD
jgi:amino acid adenylation domain